jgi:hypothetical protein
MSNNVSHRQYPVLATRFRPTSWHAVIGWCGVCTMALAGMAAIAAPIASADPVAATTSSAGPQTRPTTAPAQFKMPFKPVAGQAATRDIGAFTRGCRSDPDLYVLVLAQRGAVGWTTKEQPTLLWYLSKPTNKPVLVGLRPLGPDGKDTSMPSVLELKLPGPHAAGVHRLDLTKVKGADGGPVRLKPRVQYDCSVDVLVHTKDPSDNPSTSCRLERVPAPEALAGVSTADPAVAARRYAEAGVWFDALAGLQDLVDGAGTADPQYRQAHRELLAGQGLTEDEGGRIAKPQ